MKVLSLYPLYISYLLTKCSYVYVYTLWRYIYGICLSCFLMFQCKLCCLYQMNGTVCVAPSFFLSGRQAPVACFPSRFPSLFFSFGLPLFLSPSLYRTRGYRFEARCSTHIFSKTDTVNDNTSTVHTYIYIDIYI